MRILKTTDNNVIKIDSETSIILTAGELRVLDTLFPTRQVQAREIIKEGMEERLRTQRNEERRQKREKKSYKELEPAPYTPYNGGPVSVDD